MSAELQNLNPSGLINSDLSVVDVETMNAADERISLDYAPERALEIFDDTNIHVGEAEASHE